MLQGRVKRFSGTSLWRPGLPVPELWFTNAGCYQLQSE